MAPRHLISDIESSLPIGQTLPARRVERVASAPLKPLDRFKAGLYRSHRNSYVTPSIPARTR